MYPRRNHESGLYGYWRSGGWAIEPQFDSAYYFNGGYAAVRLEDGRYGLIGRDGTLHLLDEICVGRTPVRDEYSFSGFIDWNEEPSSCAAICTKDGRHRRWGLIDTDLNYKPLPDGVFSGATRVSPCGDHVVVVRPNRRGKKDSCGLFNLVEGRLELPCDYSCIYPPKGSSKGTIWVVRRPMRDVGDRRDNAFYDLNKREIISDWFFGAEPFSCGLGAICEQECGGGGWYFVDEALRPAFEEEYDGVDRFSCGLAGVYKGDENGYIDTTGRMRLLLPHYVDMKPFHESHLAIANRDADEWDLDIIDRKGRSRVTGLQTAVFWDGDFPHFEVSSGGERGWDGEVRLLDMDLNPIL